jgi:hypothetical protein
MSGLQFPAPPPFLCERWVVAAVVGTTMLPNVKPSKVRSLCCLRMLPHHDTKESADTMRVCRYTKHVYREKCIAILNFNFNPNITKPGWCP